MDGQGPRNRIACLRTTAEFYTRWDAKLMRPVKDAENINGYLSSTEIEEVLCK